MSVVPHWLAYNILAIYLDAKACERLVHAFVILKYDYFSCIPQGLSNQRLDYIQRLQTTAARLVSNTKRNEYITGVLHFSACPSVKE